MPIAWRAASRIRGRRIGSSTASEIIRFRALLIAAGYENRSDCDELRADPAFKLAVGRRPEGDVVLGAIPLVLATGAGVESRSQIDWVIVGGISFGTLFTLFVVPTAYTFLARTRHPAAAEGRAVPAPGHELPAPQPAE